MTNLIPITRTKVLIPQRRSELVSRTRLLDMLNDLLDFRLIILAAPAGYGKTSLLIDFVHQYPWPVCWYALDALDQDPQRFIAYFIAAIQQRFKDFGQESLTALNNSSPEDLNLDYIISAITNDIFENISEHFIIVLDDYHLLKESSTIDQFLSDFLQKADENCHVVITSRRLLTLPDLPLLVARSHVGGLSVEELIFIPEEIQQLYLQNLKQRISREEAERLAAQSEGWITGLLLTSQMMKQGMGDRLQIARASGIGLYEYLAQQVLEQQPKLLQDFLLRSSLLEEFDAEMCAQVIGKALEMEADWMGLMEGTIHNNVFVLPVGDDHLSLRYHHLFQDFLQDHMRRENPADAYKIQLELANYHASREDWERVYSIYVKMGNMDSLADMLEKIGSDLIAKGRLKTLSEWLQVLPGEKINQHPGLLSLQASVAVNRGNIQNGLDLFNQVIQGLQKEGTPKAIAENLVRRASAKRLLGDYAGSLEDSQQALEISQSDKKLELVQAEALRARGMTLYQQGQLNQGLELLEQSLKLYQKHNHEQDVARILVDIGMVQDQLGNFADAETSYKQSLKYWQALGDSVWQATLLNNLGVLQHAIGDFENSFKNLEKSMQYANMYGNLRLEGYSLASIGDLYRDLDAFHEAQDAYQKALDIAQQLEDQFLIFYLKLSQGRVQIDQGHIRPAELMLKSAQAISKQSGSLFEVNKYRLENGLYEIIIQQYSKAVEDLLTATEYFKQEGHLEDHARGQLLLAIAHYMNSQVEKAGQVLGEILARINQPQGRVTLLASASEVEPYLNSMLDKDGIGSLAGEFSAQVEAFAQRVDDSRRRIRTQATFVPFAPPKIILRAFGRTEVSTNNGILTTSDWKSLTARDLLFFFLSHPQGVTKEEVGLAFWPDSSTAELKLRFKNAIYRLRHAVGTDVVIFNDNFYLFNRSLDYEYDVQMFLNNLDRAEEEKNPEKRGGFLLAAVDLYKGRYLPDIDGDWAELDRHKYASQYLQALHEIASHYLRDREYALALQFSQRALQTDNCDEDAYRASMQAQHGLGNLAEVARTYEQCKRTLTTEVGAEPSPQTQLLYASLMGKITT